MTKQEFLTQLQRALNSKIGRAKAAEHVNYYQEYIEIALRKGRAMEEVMEELGNPGLIARSIAEAHERAEKKEARSRKFSKYAGLVKNLFAGPGKGAAISLRRWFDSLK